MSAELTKVVLVGSLGRAPGIPTDVWHLDVKSPAEAIRAININTRGALENYLRGPARDRLYRIALQKRDNVIDPKTEMGNRSGRSTIYIMPTVRGRDKGVGKIIAGIALIALAIVNPFASALLANTLIGATIVSFGVSLVLGGIAQLLTPRPQGPNASPDQAQSTSFPGNAAAVVQGSPIPVVYGRAQVAPIPVAITTTNNDVSTTAAGTVGGVTGTPLDGGGTQYNPTPGDGQE